MYMGVLYAAYGWWLTKAPMPHLRDKQRLSPMTLLLLNPRAQTFVDSRRRMVCGRFFFVVAALLAAAACAYPTIAFCNDCAASADTDCASRGLVVCNYDCSGGLCGAINARCRWECCLPPESQGDAAR
jgi:hypothetical protein